MAGADLHRGRERRQDRIWERSLRLAELVLDLVTPEVSSGRDKFLLNVPIDTARTFENWLRDRLANYLGKFGYTVGSWKEQKKLVVKAEDAAGRDVAKELTHRTPMIKWEPDGKKTVEERFIRLPDLVFCVSDEVVAVGE